MAASSLSESSSSSDSEQQQQQPHRSHRHRHRDKDHKNKDRHPRKSKRKRKRSENDDTSSSVSYSSYSDRSPKRRCRDESSTSGSDSEASDRPRKHRRRDKSKKTKEKSRGRSHKNRRHKHKARELGSATWLLDTFLAGQLLLAVVWCCLLMFLDCLVLGLVCWLGAKYRNRKKRVMVQCNFQSSLGGIKKIMWGAVRSLEKRFFWRLTKQRKTKWLRTTGVSFWSSWMPVMIDLVWLETASFLCRECDSP